MFPLSNKPLSLVTVWATVSLLRHVTFVPTGTVMDEGVNDIPCIMTSLGLPVLVFVFGLLLSFVQLPARMNIEKRSVAKIGEPALKWIDFFMTMLKLVNNIIEM